MNLFRLDATNIWEITDNNIWEITDKTRSKQKRNEDFQQGETSPYASTLLFALRGCARGRCDGEPIGNWSGTGATAGSRRNARSAAGAVIHHACGPPLG